jgi:NhaA family Na+:H+ antiporter
VAAALHQRRGRGTPASAAARSPVERVESRLHPYVAFVIMPLFALPNAGVSLKGLTLTARLAQR